VEVTDPAEPLFGKRFGVESISRSGNQAAQVFLKRGDGIVLRVPLRATNLSTLVDLAPRAKLSKSAIAEFLELVKEYELCPQIQKSEPITPGRRSAKKHDKKS
jgi:hypothetical protein